MNKNAKPNMQNLMTHFANLFNLLGSCYRLDPQDTLLAPALRVFSSGEWFGYWFELSSQLSAQGQEDEGGAKELKNLAPIFENMDAQILHEDWLRLFVGPAALPAPPWGSVYLDPERVLRGCSTVSLAAFLEREGLNVLTEHAEPPDHIGLILFQAAFLAANGRQAALQELLTEHLLTWLPFFVARLKETNPDSFYTALGVLTLWTVEAMGRDIVKIDTDGLI